MPRFKINRSATAFQLPKLNEDASEELIEFLDGLNCEYTSERDGGISITTPSGYCIMASPEDWIVKIDGSDEVMWFPPDRFEEFFEDWYDWRKWTLADK